MISTSTVGSKQDVGEPSRPSAPHASVASWLSLLFVLLLLLATVGGYVRLSGSGLSIPDWPIIQVGDTWSLLPPANESDWRSVMQRWEVDQAELVLKERRGAIGMGSLGAYPRDLPGFKRMFMIEWGHRFAAALVAIVAAGCLTVTLRRRDLRQRIGVGFGVACALIVVQAVIGGLLVKSGTATHWLFIHLGVAAAIVVQVVRSILRLVADPEARPDRSVHAARRVLARCAHAALGLVAIQLVLGALVAGSRGQGYDVEGAGNFSSTWPLMQGRFVPHHLWEPGRGLAWNLLDNALLLQWVHRWFAWTVVAALVATWIAAAHAPLSPRLRLSLKVSGTFLGVQVALGLANVWLTHPVLVSLAHLVMAFFLLATVVMVVFDIRNEAPLRIVSDPLPPLSDHAGATA